jgi:hypothetical protein
MNYGKLVLALSLLVGAGIYADQPNDPNKCGCSANKPQVAKPPRPQGRDAKPAPQKNAAAPAQPAAEVKA